MKKTINILWIAIILCLNHLAFSQKKPCTKNDKPKEIIWDFSTGDLTQPCCITKGKNLPITITNINRTIYDIKIEKEFRSIDSNIPEILDFKKMKDEVQKTGATVDNSNQLLADDDPQKVISNALIDMLNNSYKILECGECLSQVLSQDLSYDDAQIEKLKCTNGLDKNKTKTNLNTLYQSVLGANDIIKKSQINDPLIQQINLLRDQITSTVDLQKANDNIMTIYSKIEDKKTFTFSTIFPIEEAYELALKLKVSPKAGKQANGGEINLNYAIEGIKISFSPGLFINHFPGSKTYYLEEDKSNGSQTDSVFIRSTFNDKSLIPSVGALIHVSFFGCHDVDFAISAGASTRLESGDMRWHLGTSLLFGKQRRFVLSVGATLGQGIKELDQSYQLDQPYLKSAIQEQTLTTEVPHIGWFLGFSYNLPVKPKS